MKPGQTSIALEHYTCTSEHLTNARRNLAATAETLAEIKRILKGRD